MRHHIKSAQSPSGMGLYPGNIIKFRYKDDERDDKPHRYGRINRIYISAITGEPTFTLRLRGDVVPFKDFTLSKMHKIRKRGFFGNWWS